MKESDSKITVEAPMILRMHDLARLSKYEQEVAFVDELRSNSLAVSFFQGEHNANTFAVLIWSEEIKFFPFKIGEQGNINFLCTLFADLFADELTDLSRLRAREGAANHQKRSE